MKLLEFLMKGPVLFSRDWLPCPEFKKTRSPLSLIRSAPNGQRPEPAERDKEETGKNDGGKTGREEGQKVLNLIRVTLSHTFVTLSHTFVTLSLSKGLAPLSMSP